MPAPTLGSDLLEALDDIRSIGGELGLRPWSCTVRVRTWTGARVGLGDRTDVDTPIVNMASNGVAQPVYVKQLSRKEIIASGGLYTDRDWKVGPITPPYPSILRVPAGGFDDTTIDPQPTGQPTEIFWFISSPTGTFGVPPGGPTLTNWRNQANYTAYWDQHSQVVSNGFVTQWNDQTGNGRNWISVGNNPTAVTINGVQALGFSNPAQQTLALTSGASSPWTAASGWVAFVVESIGTIGTDSPNAALDQGIFGDAIGALELGLRATGPAVVATISDSIGFKNCQTNIKQTAINVVEFWWDSSNVHVRVNGGSQSSTAAGALAVLPSQPWLGSGYYAHTSNQPAGWFNGYIMAAAAAPSMPANAPTIVSAMLQEYGVASGVVCAKIWEWVTALHYFVILRATGRKP